MFDHAPKQISWCEMLAVQQFFILKSFLLYIKYYIHLSDDVTDIQWITSGHNNVMTTCYIPLSAATSNL